MQVGTTQTVKNIAKAIASASSEAVAIRGAKSYMRAHELSASRVSPFLWANVRLDGVLKEDVDAPRREEECNENGGGDWQGLEGLQTRRCARQMVKQGAGRFASP